MVRPEQALPVDDDIGVVSRTRDRPELLHDLPWNMTVSSCEVLARPTASVSDGSRGVVLPAEVTRGGMLTANGLACDRPGTTVGLTKPFSSNRTDVEMFRAKRLPRVRFVSGTVSAVSDVLVAKGLAAGVTDPHVIGTDCISTLLTGSAVVFTKRLLTGAAADSV